MTSPRDRDDGRPEPALSRRPILVVGTDAWAVEQAAVVLSDAGHETLSCHPPGEPDFPCNALVEGRVCPLDVGFDIVLTVRARPLDHPAVGETGVICGLRAGAALVTAGMGGRNPFAAWATRAVGSGNNLAEVVEGVAEALPAAVTDLRNPRPGAPAVTS